MGFFAELRGSVTEDLPEGERSRREVLVWLDYLRWLRHSPRITREREKGTREGCQGPWASRAGPRYSDSEEARR